MFLSSKLTLIFFFIATGLAVSIKPKPKPLVRCADVLLYDTFGDGWGSGIVFQAGKNVTYQLLDKFDSKEASASFPLDQLNCSTRVLQFCNLEENYEFFVDSVNGATVANKLEVLWVVKNDRKFYYGTIGSSIIIKRSEVKFDDFYDESPRAN